MSRTILNAQAKINRRNKVIRSVGDWTSRKLTETELNEIIWTLAMDEEARTAFVDLVNDAHRENEVLHTA